MRFTVRAVALDNDGNAVAPAREEEINTDTNVLFVGCTSPWEVEDRYESFWNRLNDHWEHRWPNDKEKVKVLSVNQIKE